MVMHAAIFVSDAPGVKTIQHNTLGVYLRHHLHHIHMIFGQHVYLNVGSPFRYDSTACVTTVRRLLFSVYSAGGVGVSQYVSA